MKILNIVGARPNFMKIAPIHREMGKYPGLKPLLIHTGQHYDKKMSKLFFQDLLLPEPDIYLGVGSGTHTEQTARIMLDFEKVMEEQKPDLVLVVGDVNSTAACSLVAAKMQTKIAHVEAGLRSFDRTMPEEINRMITDALSDFLFVTEKSGLENLKNEGIPDNKVFFTGNVMIDSLKFFLEKARESSILSDLQVNGSPFALVTLHRPSNVDVKENLENLFYTFSVIGKEVKIVFPMHPRTKKMIDTFDLENYVASIENLIITDPIGYLDFMQLMQNARLILTDSGGIQEETTYLGIPCITIRENTERPITVDIGTNVLVGPKADRIIHETEKIISGNGKKGKIPELWDGNAAERIVKILSEDL
ncbi:MAG: UDP-N-acetylglucosamine 2-epimerase (non-hydrolyzing) [Calditrichia bacterium]|nr:UDP-N-acetylglucosamine 2-epimerase (non-hydrolyzing) [Calditrichia bacterium]